MIASAYAGHIDSLINDQYRSVAGSLRFLHNIVRFPGCGLFDPASSRVLAYRGRDELAALLLTETIPLIEPVLAGLKLIIACMLWAGARVMGRAGAETVKLLLLEVMALTVALTVPGLVTVTICTAEAVPTV